MSRAEEDLSPEHARALIKQAIGIINGDPWLVAEATAEIAAIQSARLAEKKTRVGRRRRTRPPPRGA
jgi:hypothetical protein